MKFQTKVQTKVRTKFETKVPNRRPWRERAEEMWREATEKVTKEERDKRRLQWEDWESLRREGVDIAERELRRRRWRGARDGVVPRGYDGESIASAAILEVFEGKCRVVAGWTRERLVAELERLISRKVRLLSSLKETRQMRSEWDIAPPDRDGEPVSILAGLPGGEPNGYEGAVEAETGREGLRAGIEAQLEAEPELEAVFRCLCEGHTRTREIARKLGMTEKAALLARRRLARRLKRHGKDRNPKTKFEV